jgi:chemotaxis response regulator CheB
VVNTPIKVVLVEDSPVALGLYGRMLESSPEVEVVGTAHDGIEALKIIPQVQPNVIVTDLHMPNMDGLELIRQIMAHYPLPILVLSNVVQKSDIDNKFKALQAGALEIMPKPQGGNANSEELRQKIITKIKVLAMKKVIAKPLT